MQNSLLLGVGRTLIPLPHHAWQKHLEENARHSAAHLQFMSPEHHRVRDFAVRELPRLGVPLAPEIIARSLELPIERVIPILDELERHMTFLFRNQKGEVAWAYPVTVDPTPHRVEFSSGEKLYAA